jgi:DNA mismatch endonuclease, patch repair protein
LTVHLSHLSATPATRREFWENKLRENRERDSRALSALSLTGWRVLTVREYALRGKDRQDLVAVIEACEGFLNRPEIRNATIAGLQSGLAGLNPEPRHVPQGLGRRPRGLGW